MPDEKVYTESYENFLEAVEAVVNKRIEGLPNQESKESAGKFAERVFAGLRNEVAVAEVVKEIATLREEVRDALVAELIFFSILYGQGEDNDQTGKGTEAAHTVKSSLEDLLPDLSGWVKKLLKILNELLSLLGGG